MSDEKQFEQNRRAMMDKFVANRPFQRAFSVIDTYQQLLAENQNNEVKTTEIKQRMHELFDIPVSAQMGDKDDEQGRQVAGVIIEVRVKIFSLAESGQLTIEKMAEIIINSPIAEKFLESLNPQPGSVSETGNVRVNEVIEYVTKGQEAENLGINLMSTPVSDLAEMKQKAMEGLRKIALLMKDNGILSGIKQVNMVSWLFDNPRFAEGLKNLFGDKIQDEDDEKAIEEVQMMALSFNKQAIREFLLKNNKPKVRKVVLTKEEFISKFSS